MNARAQIIAAAFWLFGVLCGVWGINLAGGIYEYRFAPTDIIRMINVEGWQPVPDLPTNWIVLRRPRLRFP